MLTVDIDTGGTMTDALVTDGATRHSVKVDTTPHDYTIAFQACLSEAARLYGDASIERFLRRVSLIRWSSTITTNVIAERRGAKVGLLVSAGQEENLYGPERSMVVDELVAAGSIVGLSENADAAEVLAAVKTLLESGVRRICVCLAGAFPDNAAERRIKDIIEDQYPDHIIGAVPVLLGSEMAQIGHDQTRAHYSAMNAYSHTHLANSLYKAEDILRDAHRWNGALLVGHTNGGVSRIGKTKAVDTIESGPVFGTFGGAYLAKTYGLDKVACFDVGGTTTKSSVVRGGEPLFQRGGEIMEVPVKTAFAMLRSAAIGGGSVARVVDGKITLGPDSMGAAPGPASYGLGGDQATVTDALLVLGYLDAGRFMSGRRALDVTKAQAALDRAIATPLGVSVAQAAGMIRDEAAAIMAELVGGTLREAGIDPRDATLFAYGGNGPMFAAFVAERLNMTQVYAFDFGPVFSAFGSAISDVVHVYERGLGAPWASDRSSALAAASDLRRQAARDLVAEGFDPAAAHYRYELEFGHGDTIAGSLRVDFAGAPDETWRDLIDREVGLAKIDAKASLLLIRLSARFSMGAAPLEKRERGGESPPPAERLIQFNAKPAPVPCYSWEALGVGSKVEGPAIVNGATLTCPIPPGWSLTVDEYGNARLSGG